jgi:sporadic carbohydrate cluster 2OG-Fe(II) oxygenase
MYISEKEKKLHNSYLKNGYIILPVANKKAFKEIENIFRNVTKSLKLNQNFNRKIFLNDTHKYVDIKNLNNFRLKIIKKINNGLDLKELYYEICKPYINSIVGNELAIQKNINLSIQFPNDDSSLLDVHSDTWAGDSSFEVVVWLPLVDCFKTKSMYILSKRDTKKYSEIILNKNNNLDNLKMFKLIKNKIKWLNVKKGNILIFNQNLIHGNHVNLEKDTRWSMNCRFKSIFTPYSEKAIGEYFEPITLRPASKDGMFYDAQNLPTAK